MLPLGGVALLLPPHSNSPKRVKPTIRLMIVCLLTSTLMQAQTPEPLTAQRVSEMQRSAIGTIQSLADLLVRLGAAQSTMSEKAQIRANLIQHSFASDRVMLFNDLEPGSRQELRVTDYLRKLSYSAADLLITYSDFDPSPVYFDPDRQQYVMYVRVTRTREPRPGHTGPARDQRDVYVFLSNLKSVPLIFGSAPAVRDFFEEVPILGDDWLGSTEAATPSPPPSAPSQRPTRPSACEHVQRETRTFLRKTLRQDITDLDPADLLRIEQVADHLDDACSRRDSRDLQKHLKTLYQDIESGEAAERQANQLTHELRQAEMAHLSRRELSRYLRRVQRASEDLMPRLIATPTDLVARKAIEYGELAHWHESAVRHPKLHLKLGAGGGLFLPNLNVQQVQTHYPALYRHLWQAQLGLRFNRVAKAPRTPDPKTGKRHLKRAHVMGLFYQQTYAGLDLFGYQGSYNPYQMRTGHFQELEIGMLWWECWRMSVGAGQQWSSLSGETSLRQYATATTALALRFFRIFELDLGCTALWADSLPEPTLRPQASLGLVLNL